MVDGGNYSEVFGELHAKCTKNETIVNMEIMVISLNDTYLFNVVEPRRPNQSKFMCSKRLLQEAEKWLDDIFDRLLQKYEALTCKDVLGGIGHVQRTKSDSYLFQDKCIHQWLELPPCHEYG